MLLWLLVCGYYWGGCGNGGCRRFFVIVVLGVLVDLGDSICRLGVSGLVPSGLCLFC